MYSGAATHPEPSSYVQNLILTQFVQKMPENITSVILLTAVVESHFFALSRGSAR
jgi:hypothetical protein